MSNAKIKLFPRGKKKILYFRMHVKGKDKWFSTGQTEKKKAIEEATRIQESMTTSEQIAKIESDPGRRKKKIAEVALKTYGDSVSKPLPISELYEKWTEITPEFSRLHIRSQKNLSAMHKKFAEWCATNNISDFYEINPEAARKYATYLTKEKLSGKTYNEHLRFLSRLYDEFDQLYGMPYQNPFRAKAIPRIKKTDMGQISHKALEPEALKKVIEKAAEIDPHYRDIIICGSVSGLRLQDSCTLSWSSVEKDFIELIPGKTKKKGQVARIPINSTMRLLLDQQQQVTNGKGYVFPELAKQYLKEGEDKVSSKCKHIFNKALGEENTSVMNDNRQRAASLYSYHSLRSTFMSHLASQMVSTRDAMRIMCWESPEMIKVYEHELEKASGDADKRTKELVDGIKDLQFAIPGPPKKLTFTKAILRDLIKRYSNTVIGQIFNVTEASVRKHLKRHDISRKKKIYSKKLTAAQLKKEREKILKAL